MANTKSAEKRAVQSEARRKHNVGLKSTYRTYVKKVEGEISAKKKDEAMKSFKKLVPVLDKVVSKGVLHGNTAARYKSRLNSKIKAL